MFAEKAIAEWVGRACALVDNVTADYIAIHVRSGPKSWPEHATVRVESRTPVDVIEEVIGHVRDIGESAGAEGRGGAAVRLKIYRAKTPAGSRTFSSIGSHPVGSDPVRDDDEDGTPRGELSATVRELRHLVVAMGADLAQQATHGWQLAIRQQEQIATLTARNAHLEAIVRVGESSASDPMREALVGLLPQLPMILASLPAVAASRQAAMLTPPE
jgi:hypothetical protein